ncbi:hypothetical protein L810_5162 [Burkholderia sp. AU4i]|nr:hypothetical protein L810_5162 [Burkholderia sp. AU4i]
MRVDAFDALASRSGDRRRGRGCDARDGFCVKPTLVVPKSLQSSMCRNESFGPATRVERPAAVRVRTAY